MVKALIPLAQYGPVAFEALDLHDRLSRTPGLVRTRESHTLHIFFPSVSDQMLSRNGLPRCFAAFLRSGSVSARLSSLQL
jgi:hypothetical protein